MLARNPKCASWRLSGSVSESVQGLCLPVSRLVGIPDAQLEYVQAFIEMEAKTFSLHDRQSCGIT